MTTAKTPKTLEVVRIPDPPDREPEDMTSFNHLSAPGSTHHLIQHFGNSNTTIIAGEHYILPEPGSPTQGRRAPDLFIAFDVDPAVYVARNAYVVSEQGKPPDFVLEIASPSTAHIDVGEKRTDYAALGIPEYWRFDETGRHHGSRLAGDRLVDGQYEPIHIEELAEDTLQGYSGVLNLNIRWEGGQLRWYDPTTDQHIVTFDDERARADRAEAQAQELEAELQRLREA